MFTHSRAAITAWATTSAPRSPSSAHRPAGRPRGDHGTVIDRPPRAGPVAADRCDTGSCPAARPRRPPRRSPARRHRRTPPPRSCRLRTCWRPAARRLRRPGGASSGVGSSSPSPTTSTPGPVAERRAASGCGRPRPWRRRRRPVRVDRAPEPLGVRPCRASAGTPTTPSRAVADDQRRRRCLGDGDRQAGSAR